MPKNSRSQYAILGMLALFPGSSGYEIKKLMEESTDHFWKETFSSIYPVLLQLEKEALVTHEECATGGRQSKKYTLSSKGERAFADWLEQPVEMEQQRHELLLKLFFGETAVPEISLRHIEEFRAGLLQRQSMFGAIRSQLIEAEKDSPGLPYWLMTLDYGIKQVASALEWCEESIGVIKNGSIVYH